MESKWCWMLVALCALLMSNDAALADDVAVKGVDSDAAVVMQEQTAATQQLSVEHTDVRGDVLQPQVAAGGAPSKEEMEETQLPLVMAEDAQSKLEGVVAEQQSAPDAAAADEERKLEAAVNAEIAKQPSLQRLARHLSSFHDYQMFRARKAGHPNALLQRAAINIDEDDDDDAIAEERAVRRRQRVRRRNSKNKVKRTHRNKHFANRKKSTRRKHSNRNSVRRKNVKRAQSKRRRNTNRTGVRPASNSNRRSTQRRRGSNSNKRRSGSKRRKSGRKSKRKSSQKKKKKKSRRRRKHRDELADENTARQQAPGGAQAMPIGDDNAPQDAAAPAAPVVELPSH